MARFALCAGLSAIALAAGAAPALAASVQTINTNSLAFGEFGPDNRNAGPFPFNNFGVQATASMASDMAVSVNGATAFSFPTFNFGDVIHSNTSFNYGYTPSWSGGSVGYHTGLSADASFNYDIGPFSGSDSIYSAGLNATGNGSIGGGSTLTGSTAGGSAVGPTIGAGYTLSAFAASASAHLNVGLNLSNQASFNPTVQYGYYSWINTTGTTTGLDSATFTGVQSGDLSYLFPQNLDLQAGSNDFFLNFLPAVQMTLPIDASATVTIPLTGNLHAEAFGITLADKTIDLGNLYSETINYDQWNDDVTWGGGGYYSLSLHEDNSDCQIHSSTPTCETYTVRGIPIFSAQSVIPGDSTSNFTGDGHGDWNPGVQNAPNLPPVCDPSTGICYNSNDPNMPIGPGSVSFHTTSVPEPSVWLSMLLGFAGIGAHARRRRRAALVQ